MTGVPSSRSPHWTIPATIERRTTPEANGAAAVHGGGGDAGFTEVQLTSLCRICAKAGDSMVDIYDQIFAEDYRPSLDKWINEYLPIEVTQRDALPLKVCTKCSQILFNFHQLYLCCLDTKQRFDEMLRDDAVDAKVALADVVRSAKEVEAEEEEEDDNDDPVVVAHGSSELTMGSIMDGIIVDEEDFLHYEEDEDDVLDVNEDADDAGATSRNSTQEPDSMELITIEISTSKLPTSPTADVHQSGRRLRHKHACSFCKQGLHTKQRLIQHLRDTHSDQIFHCDVCDEYVDRLDLIVHMTTHALAIENSESMLSQPADSSNNSAPSIESHCINATPATTRPAPLACNQCPKTFANRSSLRYHMLAVHRQQRDFCCALCDRTFVCKRTMTNHIRSIHESERRFACTACPKAFKTDSGLYAHRKRLHDSATPTTTTTSTTTSSSPAQPAAPCARCEFCSKKFKFRGDLQRHLVMHTKETKHFCQYCNKGFGVRNNLTKHLRTHSSLLDYKCHICSYAAVQRRYLAEHMKSAHQTVLKASSQPAPHATQSGS